MTTLYTQKRLSMILELKQIGKMFKEAAENEDSMRQTDTMKEEMKSMIVNEV